MNRAENILAFRRANMHGTLTGPNADPDYHEKYHPGTSNNLDLSKFDYHNPSPEAQKFIDLADAQRGSPERAMLKVQRLMSGGVLNPVVEHVGDLTHRMSEKTALANGDMGYEFVKPKVDRTLNLLRSGYGFEREFLENIESNIRFAEENPQYGPPHTASEIFDALQVYADEHRLLPVFNQVQRHAQNAAVAVGERRWSDAITNLSVLETTLNDGREAWVREASKLGFDDEPG